MTTSQKLIRQAYRMLLNWDDNYDIEEEQEDVLETLLIAEAYAEDQARHIIKPEAENALMKEALESAGSWIAGAKVDVEPGWAGSTNHILYLISEALNHDPK